MIQNIHTHPPVVVKTDIEKQSSDCFFPHTLSLITHQYRSDEASVVIAAVAMYTAIRHVETIVLLQRETL